MAVAKARNDKDILNGCSVIMPTPGADVTSAKYIKTPDERVQTYTATAQVPMVTVQTSRFDAGPSGWSQ